LRAEVQINWQSGLEDVYTNTAATVSAPANWLAQLIFTPDSVASPLNAAAPLIPTGGEVVLHTQQLNQLGLDGVIVGEQAFLDNLPDIYVNGFVYTRVFNVVFGSPTLPTLYGQSTVTGNSKNTFNGGLLIRSGVNLDTVNQHDAQGIRVTRLVNEPGPPQLILNGNSGAYRVDFFGKTARRYQLQRRDSLVVGNWINIATPVTGGNANLSIPLPPTFPYPSYFRIEETTP
jgi:hypothetical protein